MKLFVTAFLVLSVIILDTPDDLQICTVAGNPESPTIICN